MNADSPGDYRRRGMNRGVDEAVLSEAIRQMQRARASRVRPVLTLKHLAHQTGANYVYLREIVQRKRDPYVTFSRPKRERGKLREIAAPEAPLMSVQRWLLRGIFERVPCHSASYAYQKNTSYIACAEQHLGARWLVKLDLESFFHTIHERSVYEVARTLGYNPLISLEIARLCTRYAGHASHVAGDAFRVGRRTRTGVDTYRVPRLGFLPQGSPTSGALSNLVARSLDEDLARVAGEWSLIYTRYADDLTFSTAGALGREQAVVLIRQVRRVVESHRFVLHAGKTRVVPPSGRRVVLGLLVDGDRLRLTKDWRTRLENHVYGVATYGISSHARTRGYASMHGMINHVDGLIAASHSVDPSWAASVRGRWEQALITHGWSNDDRWHWRMP